MSFSPTKPYTMTLKNKIRLALFSVAFLPFIILLFYLQNMGKERIINESFHLYHSQVHLVKKTIEQQIGSLHKEVRFMASLDLMNDMIVNDVDKRIVSLLLHKQHDIGKGVQLYAVDNEMRIIASTEKKRKSSAYFVEAYMLQKALASHKKMFISGHVLFLYAPIQSTLQENRQTGYLLLAYDLNVLQKFSPGQRNGTMVFYFPKYNIHIGAAPKNETSLQDMPHRTDTIGEEYLIVNESFEGDMPEGFVVYFVPKSHALAFLDHFTYLIWGMLGAGTLIIALLAWWIGKHIIKPVEALTETTQQIINTQDYTTQVKVHTEGEIGILSRHFNTLILTVRDTLDALEEENRRRLERFVQLITIFNALIQTETDEACVDLAVGELDKLIENAHFQFSAEPLVGTPDEMPLFVTDHAEGTEHYYGKIIRKGTPLSDDPNEARFYSAIASMVTLQLERIELLRQIRSVSEAKSVFISYMSHELRTPLHAILGATQYLIGYEALTPEQQEKVGKIESSASHLLAMINDMLDLAQIEAGKIEINMANYTLPDITEKVSESMAMVELLAEQKGLVLKEGTKVTFEGTLCTDEKYLKQIVLNLLSNAVKYTDNGEITVSYSMQEEYLAITVSDTGIGLSDEDMVTVFDAYKQIRNRHHEQGNGLGLAISKKLAKLCGGDLYLESDGRGMGTSATLLLPKCL